jgi:Yip1 domain
MAQIVDRMIRAAKLDASLFEEISRDESTMGEAVTVVVIVSVASGIGLALTGPLGLIGGAISSLVSWFLWAWLAFFVGTVMVPDAGTNTDLASVMRVTGYASAPGVLSIFGLIPFFGGLASFIGSLWMLASFIVAIRVVMNFDSNGKAALVCIIGWVVKMVIAMLFLFMGLGGALLMAT